MSKMDPTSGRTYYANTVTKQTQWDPPPVPARTSEWTTLRASEKVSTSSLVVPWTSKVDPASGKTYYVNTVTKERQWNPPADVRAEAGITVDNFEDVFSASGRDPRPRP